MDHFQGIQQSEELSLPWCLGKVWCVHKEQTPPYKWLFQHLFHQLTSTLSSDNGSVLDNEIFCSWENLPSKLDNVSRVKSFLPGLFSQIFNLGSHQEALPHRSYKNGGNTFFNLRFKGTLTIRLRQQITSNGRYGGGGSTSGRYDLVFRNPDMYYQEILYESGRYQLGVGG